MTANLEDRLRRHYDEITRDIPEHGPGLDDGVVVAINPWSAAPRRNHAARVLSLVAGSAAAALAIGLIVVNRPASKGPAIGPGTPGTSGTASATPGTTSPATIDVLVPVRTLPDGADVTETPVTVLASTPTDWYRLQPDLDIAWYQEPSGQSPSMLCWRTPVGSECLPDDGPGVLPLIVPTAGGQTLVVFGGNGAPTLEVQLAGGGVLSAPLEIDETIEWGVARYLLPDGETITAVGTASAEASEPAAIPGATLPPAVDLNEVPITIAAGNQLSYWRWLPDLDISERQTSEGGTELCWRTPAGTGCIDDSFTSPSVGIIPTDGGVIFLARPALIEITPPATDPLAPTFEHGPRPTTVVATMSDGSSVTADLNYGDEFGVGYARIALARGATVVSAASS